jgi:hypothetical protein
MMPKLFGRGWWYKIDNLYQYWYNQVKVLMTYTTVGVNYAKKGECAKA